MTRPARAAIEQAVTQAEALGHDYVGTGHMLLGLLAAGDNAGARILGSAGLGAPPDGRSSWPAPATGANSATTVNPDTEGSQTGTLGIHRETDAGSGEHGETDPAAGFREVISRWSGCLCGSCIRPVTCTIAKLDRIPLTVGP